MSKDIQFRLPNNLPQAAKWAVEELRNAIAKSDRPIDGVIEVVVGAPAPSGPESLAIEVRSPKLTLIAGSDERGLVYALLEVADAIAMGAPIVPARQSPHMPWRSMQIFIGCEKIEKGWYYSDDFWEKYLRHLAACRFNNFTLTFSHQSAYLAPIYPFHVELPEFPTVKTPTCSEEQRKTNLQRMQKISNMCRERGLHFSLGIWQQHAHEYGKTMVEGLTQDIIGDVNAVGLKRLLEACPAIDGLQFRMNVEAGVAEDIQEPYWQKQFEAIASLKRPIHVDIRAKGLSNQTILNAQKLLPDVAVSTKFWCEHLGMPYVMPAIQKVDVPSYRRYGTWDMLRKPRPFKLIQQHWTAGSHRFLIWGDEDYARRFSRSAGAYADGFEVMAPLTNKGGRNDPAEAWPLFKDSKLMPFQFEIERYWIFNELFGRYGYDPEADAASVRRQFTHRFGEAGGSAVEKAIQTGSKIIPVITTVMQFAAGMWGLWPELFAGRDLFWDITIEPSDPTRFYGMQEYSEAALAGKLDGRWTPFQTAARLQDLGDATQKAVELAERALGADHPEFAAIRHDLLVLADLAHFHADRIRAGTNMAIACRANYRPRLKQAIDCMSRARDTWKQLSDRTTGVYHDDLVFGMRDRGHHGHFRDLMKVVEKDLADLHERQINMGEDVYPQAVPETRLPGEKPYPEIAAPTLHLPKETKAGQPLTVSIDWKDATPVSGVICHFKPMLQTLPFIPLPMKNDGAGKWSATIDARHITAQWDLMVSFQIDLRNGEAVRFPDWRIEDPYRVVRTV